jgi:hypothetical protein
LPYHGQRKGGHCGAQKKATFHVPHSGSPPDCNQFYTYFGICLKDFEVSNLPSGRPTLKLHGEAARIATQLGVKLISLSITHTSELGMAHVILAG